MIDGAFLKELRKMKQSASNAFETTLKEILKLNATTSMKFRMALDKLE